MTGLDRLTNPIVLVTRPAESGARFVAALRDVSGAFQPVMQPAFEYEAVEHDDVEFEQAIFTSQAGVEHAPIGEGRIAWCVGGATAQVAGARGFEARSAAGNATDLAQMILAEKTEGRMVHFRGENVRVNIKKFLDEAGMQCSELVIYRKQICDFDVAFWGMGDAARSLIIPMFSAETVTIIRDWRIDFSKAMIVAISDEVASATVGLKPAGILVSARPNLHAMVQATTRLIA